MKTFSAYYQSLTADQKAKLAERLDTSIPYLSQLAHGHRNPGWKILRLIRTATDAEVTPESFSTRIAS